MFGAMQVDFTLEQEAQLSQIATHTGTVPEQLVRDAALRLIQEDLRFHEGVERGLADADRGAFVDSAAVWNSVEAILHAG